MRRGSWITYQVSSLTHLPGSEKETREAVMAKIDLDSMNIKNSLPCANALSKSFAEKVASRQVELEAEMERLSQYGKPSKKSQAAPAAKAKKSDEKKGDEARPEPPTRPQRPRLLPTKFDRTSYRRGRAIIARLQAGMDQ